LSLRNLPDLYTTKFRSKASNTRAVDKTVKAVEGWRTTRVGWWTWVEEGRRSSISEAEQRKRRRGAREGGRGARRERRTQEMIITFIIGRGRYLARCVGRSGRHYTMARPDARALRGGGRDKRQARQESQDKTVQDKETRTKIAHL
jgi:hypothetical protein